jgi:hypothetical protein
MHEEAGDLEAVDHGPLNKGTLAKNMLLNIGIKYCCHVIKGLLPLFL